MPHCLGLHGALRIPELLLGPSGVQYKTGHGHVSLP